MSVLLSLNPITTAIAITQTSDFTFAGRLAPRNLLLHANFVYGSGGTSFDAYVQTSFDNGGTWCDITQFHFLLASARKIVNLSSMTPVTTQATPTDGAMTANTALDGVLGDLLRVKYTSAGTYAGGTKLTIMGFSGDLIRPVN